MDRLAALCARLEPPPRLVDWSLFGLVALAVATGVVSLGVGRPPGAVVFWLHAVAGLSLPVLLAVKFRRVAVRVRDARLWDRATPVSLFLAGLVVAAVATGAAWAVGATLPLDFWTLLNVHVLFGALVVPALLYHLRARYRPLRRTDLRERRVALQYLTLVALGGLTATLLRRAATLLSTPAATRRFTGSRRLDGALPATSWVADDPDPVDPATWTLAVDGAVSRPLELGVSDLGAPPTATRRARLDCTSGWYADREWRGVTLGALLAAADPDADARWVTVRSVTGYRWSIPLAEARAALLATHLSGARLDHGHGYPLRLVAPGRRGFQWVKWVDRVEVRRHPDPSQWVAVFLSGFTD
ncbi:MAG: molybdopterin-dependent oxidoreductase [Haloplanus sp.]